MGRHDEVIARFRAKRLALGFTQAEVAEAISVNLGRAVSPVTISHAERGNRDPSIEFLTAWARALGLSLVVGVEE